MVGRQNKFFGERRSPPSEGGLRQHSFLTSWAAIPFPGGTKKPKTSGFRLKFPTLNTKGGEIGFVIRIVAEKYVQEGQANKAARGKTAINGGRFWKKGGGGLRGASRVCVVPIGPPVTARPLFIQKPTTCPQRKTGQFFRAGEPGLPEKSRLGTENVFFKGAAQRK